MSTSVLDLLAAKLPAFDPSWTQERQDEWVRMFNDLRRQASPQDYHWPLSDDTTVRVIFSRFPSVKAIDSMMRMLQVMRECCEETTEIERLREVLRRGGEEAPSDER